MANGSMLLSVIIMKFTIIILTLVVYTFAEPIPVRPVHPVFAKWNRDSKIVGGLEATPNSIPYQVGLHLDGYFCGGSLIAEKWVLTAAHCGELTGTPQVVLGAHKIFTSESTQFIITGKAPIIHPEWNRSTMRNDISLIELPQRAPINQYIATVALAPANAGDYAGKSATASGWGRDSDSSTSSSDVLRVVSSTIMTNFACQRGFGYNIPIYDTMICLDGSQGKSTCNGDSGGPLVADNVLIGLTSFGVSSGCQKLYPAAFTRISSYHGWIGGIIGL